MSRFAKIALAVAVFFCALLSQALYAMPIADRCADTSVGLCAISGVYLAGPCAPRVSIARNALCELRERMAGYDYPTGICLMGPLADDPRAPESIEDAWLLEKLYGPAPRWTLSIVPIEEITDATVDPGETFHSGEINGMAVGILTSKTVSHLMIELHGDAIRVYELDA